MSKHSRAVGVVGRVFVSYAHEDSEFVVRLISVLRGEGIPVTSDQEFPLGIPIVESVERALGVAEVVLVVLSGHSRGSKWVSAERSAAFHQALAVGEPKVVPILRRGYEVPLLFKDLPHIKLLRWSDRRVQELACHLRGLLGIADKSTQDVVSQLREAYRVGLSPVRVRAIDTLFAIGSCECITELLGDIEIQREEVKREVAKRLSYYIGSSLAPHYRRLAASGDPQLAPSGWLCLFNLGDHAAFRKLLAMIASDSAEMRQNVLRNLARVARMGMAELREVTRAIRSCLHDPDPHVRQTALDTAMKFKGTLAGSGRLRQSVIADVRNLLDDPHSEVRRLAGAAFGHLTDE